MTQSQPDSPFGRQPQPVSLVATGEAIDIANYFAKIKRLIESRSFDEVVIKGNTLTIYPGAVND